MADYKVRNLMTVQQLAIVLEGDAKKQNSVIRKYLSPRLKKKVLVPPALTVVRPFPYSGSEFHQETGPIMVVCDDKLKTVLLERGITEEEFIASTKFEFLNVGMV